MNRWLLLLVPLFGLAAMSPVISSEYVQTSCDIYDYGVGIWMTHESDLGRAGFHDHLVDFQIGGVVVRLPPRAYTVNWDTVNLLIEYSDEEASSGVLILQLPRASWSAHERPIGVIQRECWEAVKVYVESNVIDDGKGGGISVGLTETVTNAE